MREQCHGDVSDASHSQFEQVSSNPHTHTHIPFKTEKLRI